MQNAVHFVVEVRNQSFAAFLLLSYLNFNGMHIFASFSQKHHFFFRFFPLLFLVMTSVIKKKLAVLIIQQFALLLLSH